MNMNDTVDRSPLTESQSGLQSLHNVDNSILNWLETIGTTALVKWHKAPHWILHRDKTTNHRVWRQLTTDQLSHCTVGVSTTQGPCRAESHGDYEQRLSLPVSNEQNQNLPATTLTQYTLHHTDTNYSNLHIKSTNSVIHDVFWAYLSHNFVKDKLCACVFKSRNAVVAGIYDDFMVQ